MRYLLKAHSCYTRPTNDEIQQSVNSEATRPGTKSWPFHILGVTGGQVPNICVPQGPHLVKQI